MSTAWNPRQIYRLGEQVTLNTSTWSCARDYNLNNAPANSSEWWTAVTGPAAGVTTVATITSAFPQPPNAGQNSITPIGLVLPADLDEGALYWVSCCIKICAFNSDGSTRAVEFVDSMDTLGLQLSNSALNLAASNNACTVVGLRDRPGQVDGVDQYPQWLTAQLQTDVEVTQPLNLIVYLQNKSGTCSWGTASSLEVTVYKV